MNVEFKAKRIDNNEWVTGFFTKKKIGNLIVPVIEVYKEWDSGDYMETLEIDGDTLVQVQNILTTAQLEKLMWEYCDMIGSDSVIGLHVCDDFKKWLIDKIFKIN